MGSFFAMLGMFDGSLPMANHVVPRLRVAGFDVDYEQGGFCCRVLLGRRDGQEFRLSVSYPPDARGSLETALVRDGSLFYVDEVGYWDVCRFDEVSEIVEELRRLQAACEAGELSQDQRDGEDED